MASLARHCHNCGVAVAYRRVTLTTRCLRCRQHLHVCGNCFYFDGIACELQRPEAHDVIPGLECPKFEFRKSAPRSRQKHPRKKG
jgi:hypothetical protein